MFFKSSLPKSALPTRHGFNLGVKGLQGTLHPPLKKQVLYFLNPSSQLILFKNAKFFSRLPVGDSHLHLGVIKLI